MLSGAAETLRYVDLAPPRGLHPHVGALDVLPVVTWTTPAAGPRARPPC